MNFVAAFLFCFKWKNWSQKIKELTGFVFYAKAIGYIITKNP